MYDQTAAAIMAAGIVIAGSLFLILAIRISDRVERKKAAAAKAKREAEKAAEAEKKKNLAAELKFFSADRQVLDLEKLIHPPAGWSPAQLILKEIIICAIANKAWTFSVQPFEEKVRCRMRRAGGWKDFFSYPAESHPAVGLEIERIWGYYMPLRDKLPAAGLVTLKYPNNDWVDLFVSSVPGIHGTIFTFSFCNREKSIDLDLDNLGFSPKGLQAMKSMVDSGRGLAIFLGPTGSGKSAACYSSLLRRRAAGDSIATVELPRKFPIPGARQLVVPPGSGYAPTIAKALESDPRVLMVQEFRDFEILDMMLSVAADRLALTAWHVQDVVSALFYFQQIMGLPPKDNIANLKLLSAGRVLGKICPHCRAVVEVPAAVFKRSGMDLKVEGRVKTYAGRGCDSCYGSGFLGRTGVHEVLAVSGDVKRLLAGPAPKCAFIRKAREAGMTSMREEALKLALEGVTSVQEALFKTPVPYFLEK